MPIKKSYIALIILLLCVGTGAMYGQENRTEVRFEFRVNATKLDSLFRDNATHLRELTRFLDDVRNDSLQRLVEVSFCGTASPEGSSELNRRLSSGRLSSLERLVREKIDLPDSIVSRCDTYIPWSFLKEEVEKSDIRGKEKILEIIDQDPVMVEYRPGATIDRRVLRLMRVDGGRAWKILLKTVFEKMRFACAVVVSYREIVPEPVPEPEPVEEIVEPEPEPEPEPAPEPLPEWTRHLYIKTNGVGWAFGMTNIAVEVDIAKHWSATVPVYWSSWNYFKSTLKFRTLAFQPEVRYWLSENNDGWFAGAHFGLAWYNFATDGDYRIQDHNGSSPSPGGGLAIGYRLPLSNSRWKIEFSVGAGVYPLHYDKFYNCPNGLLTETVKKTYFGLDQANISIAYTIDLGKKGGVR